jgi:hypothetical protein
VADELERIRAINDRLVVVEATLTQLLGTLGTPGMPRVVRLEEPVLPMYELLMATRDPVCDTATHIAFVMRWRALDKAAVPGLLEMVSLSPRERLEEYVDVGRSALEEEERD